jgi:hypothetical protein
MSERPGLVRRIFGGLRDAWLILGITLIMSLCLEGIYSVFAGRTRPSQAIPMPPTHPYAGTDWFPAFNTGPDGPSARHFVLDPYRFHRETELHTRFINVDSLGHRFTAYSAAPAAAKLRVWLLGGSVMWGFTVRDSFTIPSFFAQALRSRGLQDVEVLNLAESGYNSSQEATTLLYEIARSGPPDAAIFLNGYNDMATAFKWKQPGMVYDLDRSQQKVDNARAGIGRQLLGIVLRSRLVQRFAPEPTDAEEDVPASLRGDLCPAVARYYRNIALETEGIGRGMGFPVYYFLQPMHHVTAKPLSEHERTFRREPAFQECTRQIDSLMQDWNGTRYFPAYRYFDQESATVFVDRHSHLTEAANRELAERMADIVVPGLKERVASRE